MIDPVIPTFATPPTFLGVANTDPKSKICVAGVPYDVGTTHRAGARFGPSAIRQISRMLVDGVNPLFWRDPNQLNFADIGDFRIRLGEIVPSLKVIEEQAAQFDHLVTLGGDHTITLPLLRAVAKKHGPVGLVHFDAHLDTWPESFGQPFSHGNVFYHAINEGLVDPHRMIQIGIRSPTEKDTFDWTLGKGVRIITAEEAHQMTPEAIAKEIIAKTAGGKTYLTFDIDALDPSQAPGTGTPEVGGLMTWQVNAIMKRLEPIHWIGMDVVEVCPPYDVGEITALAAATIAWHYLTMVAGRLA